ncbi:MAG: SRPBCC family protein [Bacteroidia bacterium]|nr:SRPBCC family protein [Bacteroidia bacterium]
MKTFRNILIWLLGVLFLLFAISYILPEESVVERQTTIEAPAELIYSLLIDLQKWPEWSPFHAMDPDMKVSYGSITKGVGATYSWTGPVIGEGAYEITKTVEPNSMQANLDFGHGEPALDLWNLEQAGPATTIVTWKVVSHLGDPVSKYFGLVMDAMMGQDFENGLKTLKEVSEKMFAATMANG